MSADHAHRAGRGRTVFALKLAISTALLVWLLAGVDRAALWIGARNAAPAWMALALAVFFANVVASAWRWRLLLDAQEVRVPGRTLLASYLVAGFFNNFLPSNIGGDVVRIRDTAAPAGSKTRATTVILVDRGIGLMGLVFVAAVGATFAAAGPQGAPIVWPAWLWGALLLGSLVAAPAVLAPELLHRALQPLTAIHQDWVAQRIDTLTGALARFRARPVALVACFAGAILVQALLVGFYLAVAVALHVPIAFWDLAILVPLSFILQMLPLSVNGFGVREATFTLYFGRIGLPPESAVLLSLMAAGLMMLFSLSGAVVYLTRTSRRAPGGAATTATEPAAYPD